MDSSCLISPDWDGSDRPIVRTSDADLLFPVMEHSESGHQPGDLLQSEEVRAPPEMRRPKEIEDETAKPRKLVTDLSLDRGMLADAIRRRL